MNPTICKACGGKIEPPTGFSLCDRCFYYPTEQTVQALEGQRSDQNERLADARRSFDVIPDHPEAQRPDPTDLTPILIRRWQQEHDEAVRLKWQKRGAWCFVGLAVAVGILFIMWGCRQLP